jgi:serine/threonine protein kinase
MPDVQRIARYEVEGVLRVEPLGRVALGRLPEVNRAVLIKELCPPSALPAADRDRLLRAFEEECRLLGGTTHAGVVRPLDFGRTPEGTAFLVFERPEDAGLEPLPTGRSSLPPAEWLRLGAQACRALAALEEREIAPVQLRPECLFLTAGGEVRLLHLQLAQLVPRLGLPRSLLTADGPHPAAPELVTGGAVTGAALVYSTAAWLYAALGGSPGNGGRLEPLWAVNPEIPGAVDDAIQRSLCPLPAERYASVCALAEALEAAAVSRPANFVQPSVAAEPDRRSDSPVLSYGLWAVGLAVAGALGGWMAAQLVPPR